MELVDETDEGVIKHIGIKRRSGRYPWGSGGNELARSKNFKGYYEELKSKGLSDTQIAEAVTNYANSVSSAKAHPITFSTTDLRAAVSISGEHIYADNVATAEALKRKQMSNIAIAERMGLGPKGESTVRGWLKASEQRKESVLRSTANRLKEEVAEKDFLDVGIGTHLHMGITETKLRTAVAMLRDEGYQLHNNIKLPQAGTDKLTTYKVLTKEGVTWREAKDAVVQGRLRTVAAQSDDGGLTFKMAGKNEPVSMNLKRVAVKYKEDGGEDMDGVIELRRGVPDISLGANNYAQVRIAVNGTHYLKGMAIYADDLPAGVDMRFNTNKSKNDPKVIEDGKAAGDLKLGTMKALKGDDAPNRFGAETRPHTYVDAKGKEHVSPLNIVNEAGDWSKWSKNLSSQMLSKQSLALASKQLGEAAAKRRTDLDEILQMTNKVVKEKLLMEFADSADSAAVHLKAAALPRQTTRVLLPLVSLRRNEAYAPGYENGEKLVLVRHPHGGPFEIPELVVNNRNTLGRRLLKGAEDAIGIHPSVAAQLSGADFDGDTVLAIPNAGRKVKTRPPLEGLKDFDPKQDYRKVEGMRIMKKADTQREMGRISNLITDMTIQGASDDELARAVRHSMVVIDAEKHELNYKLSEQRNGVADLMKKYQNRAGGGAYTIISRSSSPASIPQVKQPPGKKGIDPKTGRKIRIQTDDGYYAPVKDKQGNPTGEVKWVGKVTKGSKMEFVDDARELLSGGKPGDKITPDRGQPIERIYADYANSMKAMANEARKAQVRIDSPRQNPTAKTLYRKEASSLQAKLEEAQKNAPLERRAQALAHGWTKSMVDANPGWDKDDIKKATYANLKRARDAVGAGKTKIFITDREWDAVQSGAVAATTLRKVLASADMDRVKTLATPRARTALSPGQLTRARSLAAMGKSTTEIAEQLGLPRSTVADNLKNA